MTPERLQQIVDPFEKILSQMGFDLDGEPMVDGSVRMASLVNNDGVIVDYSFEVKEDQDEGDYNSRTCFTLHSTMRRDGETLEMTDPTFTFSANIPAPALAKEAARDTLRPLIEAYLN